MKKLLHKIIAIVIVFALAPPNYSKCHQKAGLRCIVGAGCEVSPATPLENLRIMADYSNNNA